MKAFAVIITLAGSASAFAPVQQSRSSTALADKPFSDALGVQAPVRCSRSEDDSALFSYFMAHLCLV